MISSSQGSISKKGQKKKAKIILLVISAVIVIIILNAPLSIRSGAYSLQAGDVALQDILATRSLSYTSKVLTERAQNQARNTASPVYLPVDPVIKKKQLEKLNDIFVFIDYVRSDPYATKDQKVADLVGLSTITLNDDARSALVEWSETRWTAVKMEARQVLDESLRSTIRVENVETVKRNLDSKVDISFTNEQVSIIRQLVMPLIVPNSVFSEELTNAAREDAAKNIQPVVRNFAIGQIIVQHGQIVTPEDIEALEIAGLANQDNTLNSVLASIAMVVILAVFVGLYLYRRRAHPLDELRSLVLVALVFCVFLLLVRFAIPYRAILPFIFPVAAFGLTLATAFNLEIGLIFALVLSILAGYNLPGSLEITVYYMVGSLTGIMVLGRGRRISGFFWSSIGITVSNIAVILAYRLGEPSTDWFGLATLGGAAVINGLASASLTLILQYIFAQALGITTALQLLEISRPDHPLLQYLLRNAPGTYQHSLQVSNLAEQAADKINADSLLVRVGALYHDVGKAVNPQFFIENQVKGNENPHDELAPAVSASIIINHVNDGMQLAKKYRMVPRIQDFITEHHGTQLTRYQYNRALQEANGAVDNVDEKLFRYPGPSPRSRETALLMLADACEARARAEIPKDEAELRTIIQKVIDYALKEKQLDHTRLSLDDLTKITDSFVSTLMGVYHQRIIYPENTPLADSDPSI